MLESPSQGPEKDIIETVLFMKSVSKKLCLKTDVRTLFYKGASILL